MTHLGIATGIVPYRGAAAPAAPQAPQTNLVWHLDAGAIVGLSDNDPVGSWPDSSPAEVACTASGAARPTYKTNVINGLPAVLFNGTANWMLNSSWTDLTQPNTTYVLMLGDTDGNRQVCDGKFSGKRHAFATTGLDPDWRARVYAGSLYDDVADANDFPLNTWIIYSHLWNTASSEMYKDGVSLNTGNCGSHQMGQVRLGTFDESSAWWSGYIANFLVYNEAHDATERADVVAYLNTLYNLGL
jgi:hypothetical protein